MKKVVKRGKEIHLAIGRQQERNCVLLSIWWGRLNRNAMLCEGRLFLINMGWGRGREPRRGIRKKMSRVRGPISKLWIH